MDDADCYEPMLVKTSFKNNYEYYEIRGDRDKELSIKQYLYIVITYLAELINKKKKKNELKIQLSMGISFMCITDKEKTRSFYVNSNNEEIRLGDDESFLNNYQKDEQISRNGSNYTFESVDILSIHFHDIKLKRGKSYIEFQNG